MWFHIKNTTENRTELTYLNIEWTFRQKWNFEHTPARYRYTQNFCNTYKILIWVNINVIAQKRSELKIKLTPE